MKRNQLNAFLILPAVFAFIFGNAQSYKEQISQYLRTDIQMKAVPSALTDFNIINVDNSKSMKADVVIAQQKINDIPVFGKSANFLIKDNKIVYATNSFATSVLSISKVADAKASLSPEAAFTIAANKLKIKDQSSYQFAKNFTEKKGLLKTKSINDVTDKLVYFIKGSEARLAYEIRFAEKGSANYWLTLVDAQNSEILLQNNLTVKDHFHDSANFLGHDYNDDNATKTVAYPLNKTATTSLLKASAAKYNVFKLPVESPIYGGRSIVNEPTNPTYAPLGWHDTQDPNFEPFKDYTFGNNVIAFSDPNNINDL